MIWYISRLIVDSRLIFHKKTSNFHSISKTFQNSQTNKNIDFSRLRLSQPIFDSAWIRADFSRIMPQISRLEVEVKKGPKEISKLSNFLFSFYWITEKASFFTDNSLFVKFEFEFSFSSVKFSCKKSLYQVDTINLLSKEKCFGIPI